MRVDPVKGTSADDGIELMMRQRPFLKGTNLDLNTWKWFQVEAGQGGQSGTQLDGGHAYPMVRQRHGQLSSATADLKNVGTLDKISGCDDRINYLLRVGRSV